MIRQLLTHQEQFASPFTGIIGLEVITSCFPFLLLLLCVTFLPLLPCCLLPFTRDTTHHTNIHTFAAPQTDSSLCKVHSNQQKVSNKSHKRRQESPALRLLFSPSFPCDRRVLSLKMASLFRSPFLSIQAALQGHLPTLNYVQVRSSTSFYTRCKYQPRNFIPSSTT